MEKKETKLTKEEMRELRLRARQKILERDAASSEVMVEHLKGIAEAMSSKEPTGEKREVNAMDLLKLAKSIK